MTDDRVPPRKVGGHELPDHVQDRPEQNAGYDAAVRGRAGDPLWDAAERADEDMDARVADAAENEDPIARIDDRAEQDAANEVRRRERQNR
jgi:hypothetical protein